METYQEKSDDPSNHYGGISRGAMNEIKDCIDALLAAVQNSEEYQEFEKYRDLLKENPELMDRVNAFRGNNFRLQNEANRDEQSDDDIHHVPELHISASQGSKSA